MAKSVRFARRKRSSFKKRRAQIGKKSKVARRKRSIRRYRIKGGEGGVEGLGIKLDLSNTIAFSTYYFMKYAKKLNNINPTKVKFNERFRFGYNTIPDNSVLWVIDMQNDFIDDNITEPDEDEDILPDGGAFAVSNGVSCVKKINELIKTYGKKFKKIVYTRDWHSPNHCSFGKCEKCGPKTGYEGKYPPHCIYNSLGADLNSTTKSIIDRNEDTYEYFIKDTTIPVDIVFKGHHSNTDSYGAIYKDGDYLKERQNKNGTIVGIQKDDGTKEEDKFTFHNSSCCIDGQCIAQTGVFKLKHTARDARAKKVFMESDINTLYKIDNSKKYKSDTVMSKIDEEMSDKLSEKYFEPYGIDNYEPGPGGKIYVVGLAGEFCVKDTAIGLKAAFPQTDVYVIQDLTRYVFLPYIYGFQRKKLINPDDAELPRYSEETWQYGDWFLNKDNKNQSDPEIFQTEFDKGKEKGLHKYLFKEETSKKKTSEEETSREETSGKEENKYKQYKRLTKEELVEYDKLSIDDNTANLSVNSKIADPLWSQQVTEIMFVSHFVSDHRILIKDYINRGVQILFDDNLENKSILAEVRKQIPDIVPDYAKGTISSEAKKTSKAQPVSNVPFKPAGYKGYKPLSTLP